jgi:putative membrane protein
MMWGYGGLGVLWMALFWVTVIVLVVWAIRGTEATRSVSPKGAIEILEERFARGELDADDFKARREELVR